MKPLKINDMILEPGRPKIAIPISGRTHEEIVAQCEDAVEGPCDILEWRVDYYLNTIGNLDQKVENMQVHPELVRILDDIDYVAEGKPVIFTVRGGTQGGLKPISRKSAYDLGRIAAQSQLVSIVDMDLFEENDTFDADEVMEQVDAIHEYGVKVILSYHDFEHMLSREEIINLVSLMRNLGADICKIAVTSESRDEVDELVKTAALVTEGDNGPVIILAMGEEGRVTRIAGGEYGSCITYAAGTKATAPGQMSAEFLSEMLDKFYK